MRKTGPEIVTALRDELQVSSGRHFYAVLGSYAQLTAFEQHDLCPARDVSGALFLPPVNLNRQLLARIRDEDLRRLVKDEARRPRAAQKRLQQELDGLLGELFATGGLLILKQVEILFAHHLDLSVFRIQAINDNHLLLLLPGEKRGDHIVLFHEAEPAFHRSLPQNLVAENHLWELPDD